MVETSGDKVSAWQPEVVEVEAPRPRRKRPAVVNIPDEPLVMIETAKKD